MKVGWFPEQGEMENLGLFSELFFMIIYGYILFYAANLIGDGSERLLLLYGPGVVGGLVIPILGAIPDGAIIFFSGFGPDKEKVQDEIAVGVGTLAGSTIMLLTLPFAGTIWLGSRILDREGNVENVNTRSGKQIPRVGDKWDWNDGIKVEESLPMSAKIMMVTSLSFLVIQIPAFIYFYSSDRSSKEHLPALIGLILSLSAFCGYSFYQLKAGASQELVKLKEEQTRIKAWKRTMTGRFQNLDKVMDVVFSKFDKNKDGMISTEELSDGLGQLGLNLERKDLTEFLKEFDTDSDFKLDKTEFATLAREIFDKRTMSTARLSLPASNSQVGKFRKESQQSLIVNEEQWGTQHKEGQEIDGPSKSEILDVEQAFTPLRDSDEEDEEESEELFWDMTDSSLKRSALLLLLTGTALVSVFSDPMVATIGAFANTTGIPAFYVSFIVTPLASNASEVLASLRFAQRKSKECVTLSLASLYGAACMNNTFCLSIFFALIYAQNLEWDFSAETITILAVICIVGMNGLTTVYRNYQGILIALLFPLSIGMIAGLKFLDN